MRQTYYLSHLADKQANISARVLTERFKECDYIGSKSDAMLGRLDTRFDAFKVVVICPFDLLFDSDNCRMTRTVCG